MADIINTPRGPVLKPSGSIQGTYFIIPVLPSFTGKLLSNFWRRPTYEREYYERRADGEWHWTHTETAGHQKYPDPPPPPEHPLPEGV